MDDHLLPQVVAVGLQADDRTLLSDEFALASRSIYVMEALRSIVLEDLEWGTILPGFGVAAVLSTQITRRG
jgi:hypothetical protein